MGGGDGQKGLHPNHPASIIEGWMDKLGSFVKSWKRRYFVLDARTGTLHYYKSASDTHEVGSVQLPGGSVAVGGPKRPHSFLITPSKETAEAVRAARRGGGALVAALSGDDDGGLWMAAETVFEQNKWVEALRKGCAMPPPPSSSPSSSSSLASSSSAAPRPGGSPGGIFGAALVDTVAREGAAVPRLMVDAMAYVEARALEVVGIYRLSGNASEIAGLKARYDAREEVDLSAVADPHAVSGTLKLFLRELAEPLLTFDAYPEMMMIGKLPEGDPDIVPRLTRQIASLPRPHVDSLRALVAHIRKVGARSEVNKMGRANLVTVFAPNLLRARVENMMAMVADMPIVSRVCSLIVDHAEDVIPPPPSQSPAETAAPPAPVAPGAGPSPGAGPGPGPGPGALAGAGTGARSDNAPHTSRGKPAPPKPFAHPASRRDAAAGGGAGRSKSMFVPGSQAQSQVPRVFGYAPGAPEPKTESSPSSSNARPVPPPASLRPPGPPIQAAASPQAAAPKVAPPPPQLQQQKQQPSSPASTSTPDAQTKPRRKVSFVPPDKPLPPRPVAESRATISAPPSASPSPPPSSASPSASPSPPPSSASPSAPPSSASPSPPPSSAPTSAPPFSAPPSSASPSSAASSAPAAASPAADDSSSVASSNAPVVPTPVPTSTVAAPADSPLPDAPSEGGQRSLSVPPTRPSRSAWVRPAASASPTKEEPPVPEEPAVPPETEDEELARLEKELREARENYETAFRRASGQIAVRPAPVPSVRKVPDASRVGLQTLQNELRVAGDKLHAMTRRCTELEYQNAELKEAVEELNEEMCDIKAKLARHESKGRMSIFQRG